MVLFSLQPQLPKKPMNFNRFVKFANNCRWYALLPNGIFGIYRISVHVQIQFVPIAQDFPIFFNQNDHIWRFPCKIIILNKFHGIHSTYFVWSNHFYLLTSKPPKMSRLDLWNGAEFWKTVLTKVVELIEWTNFRGWFFQAQKSPQPCWVKNNENVSLFIHFLSNREENFQIEAWRIRRITCQWK